MVVEAVAVYEVDVQSDAMVRVVVPVANSKPETGTSIVVVDS